jgi:hypothetical protein
MLQATNNIVAQQARTLSNIFVIFVCRLVELFSSPWNISKVSRDRKILWVKENMASMFENGNGSPWPRPPERRPRRPHHGAAVSFFGDDEAGGEGKLEFHILNFKCSE